MNTTARPPATRATLTALTITTVIGCALIGATVTTLIKHDAFAGRTTIHIVIYLAGTGACFLVMLAMGSVRERLHRRHRVHAGTPTSIDMEHVVETYLKRHPGHERNATATARKIVAEVAKGARNSNGRALYEPATVLAWVQADLSPRLLLRAIDARADEHLLTEYLTADPTGRESIELILGLMPSMPRPA